MLFITYIFLFICILPGADPGFGVMGDEIRQGDLRVLHVLLFIVSDDVYGTYKIDSVQVILIYNSRRRDQWRIQEFQNGGGGVVPVR